MDDDLKTMWAGIRPGTPDDLAGARQRLMRGIEAPAARRRAFGGFKPVFTAPRLLAAAGVAAAVAAAPLVIGGGDVAYAVTENPDGTISVTVNELQDPDGLESRLTEAGIAADVTFLPVGKKCRSDRFESVDISYSSKKPEDMTPEERAEYDDPKSWRSAQATRPTSMQTIRIAPQHIRQGETLVLEFRDNHNPRQPWQLGAWLAEAGSPVQPCTLVDDPAPLDEDGPSTG